MKEYEKILKKYPKREEVRFQILDNNTIILCCAYYGCKYTVCNVNEFVEFRKNQGYTLRSFDNILTLFNLTGHEKEITNPIKIIGTIHFKVTQLLRYEISKNNYVCLNPTYLKKVYAKGLRLYTQFKFIKNDFSSVGFVYLVDDNNEVKAVICPVKVKNILKEIERVTKKKMISIKGINKYTKYEKAALKRALLYNVIVECYKCKDCEYKHLCKDINDLLKSGILD